MMLQLTSCTSTSTAPAMYVPRPQLVITDQLIQWALSDREVVLPDGTKGVLLDVNAFDALPASVRMRVREMSDPPNAFALHEIDRRFGEDEVHRLIDAAEAFLARHHDQLMQEALHGPPPQAGAR